MNLVEFIPRAPTSPGVYVVRGINRLHYTGAARNLAERLRDHHAGRGKRTKNQRPLEVIHIEVCADYSAALDREIFLKSGQGRQWLQTHQTVSP